MWFSHGVKHFEVNCPSSLSWDKTANLSVNTSAAGYTRAAYFGGPRILRTMNLAHNILTPEAAGKIEALTHLGFGSEFGFIPTGATRSNLLTPGASLLATATGSERRPFTQTQNGDVYPSGVNTPTTARIATALPFPFAGQRVCLSVVGRNGGVCSIEWLTDTGAVISYSGVTAGQSDYARSSVIVTAPDNAVAFGMHVRGDVAAPAVTLEKLFPWAVGQSAKHVVIDGGGGEILTAWNKKAGLTTRAQYTVREVGEYV